MPGTPGLGPGPSGSGSRSPTTGAPGKPAEPGNLLATSDDVNRDKSDQDPTQFRPEVDPCRYAQIYRTVKQHYQLMIISGQDAELNDMCPHGAK